MSMQASSPCLPTCFQVVGMPANHDPKCENRELYGIVCKVQSSMGERLSACEERQNEVGAALGRIEELSSRMNEQIGFLTGYARAMNENIALSYEQSRKTAIGINELIADLRK